MRYFIIILGISVKAPIASQHERVVVVFGNFLKVWIRLSKGFLNVKYHSHDRPKQVKGLLLTLELLAG